MARKKVGDDMAMHSHIQASIDIEKIGQAGKLLNMFQHSLTDLLATKSKPKKDNKKVADTPQNAGMAVNEGRYRIDAITISLTSTFCRCRTGCGRKLPDKQEQHQR